MIVGITSISVTACDVGLVTQFPNNSSLYTHESLPLLGQRSRKAAVEMWSKVSMNIV
jgi:hypothetical protein